MSLNYMDFFPGSGFEIFRKPNLDPTEIARIRKTHWCASNTGRTILQALGLKLNDRVVVGNKIGTLRYVLVTR